MFAQLMTQEYKRYLIISTTVDQVRLESEVCLIMSGLRSSFTAH
jgi:hypothetical protein